MLLLLTPINETGHGCSAWLHATFQQVQALLGVDNVTHEDDEDKVGAAWAFADPSGRKAFVWAYGYRRGQATGCQRFSVDGSLALVEELFPGRVEER